MIPIWQRGKNEAGDEECAKFYMKHTMTRRTAKVIRVSAEELSYKALLFIPKAPYNY